MGININLRNIYIRQASLPGTLWTRHVCWGGHKMESFNLIGSWLSVMVSSFYIRDFYDLRAVHLTTTPSATKMSAFNVNLYSLEILWFSIFWHMKVKPCAWSTTCYILSCTHCVNFFNGTTAWNILRSQTKENLLLLKMEDELVEKTYMYLIVFAKLCCSDVLIFCVQYFFKPR